TNQDRALRVPSSCYFVWFRGDCFFRQTGIHLAVDFPCLAPVAALPSAASCGAGASRSRCMFQIEGAWMFQKVLVLSASAGAGHVRAAEAVEKAFRELGAAREVRHVDTLDYTNKLFRHLYAKAYLDLVQNAPTALGWLYDHLDKPWRNERRRLALDRLNTRPFVKLLTEYRPDITVCTHFLPAEIISWLKAK